MEAVTELMRVGSGQMEWRQAPDRVLMGSNSVADPSKIGGLLSGHGAQGPKSELRLQRGALFQMKSKTCTTLEREHQTCKYRAKAWVRYFQTHAPGPIPSTIFHSCTVIQNNMVSDMPLEVLFEK